MAVVRICWVLPTQRIALAQKLKQPQANPKGTPQTPPGSPLGHGGQSLGFAAGKAAPQVLLHPRSSSSRFSLLFPLLSDSPALPLLPKQPGLRAAVPMEQAAPQAASVTGDGDFLAQGQRGGPACAAVVAHGLRSAQGLTPC